MFEKYLRIDDINKQTIFLAKKLSIKYERNNKANFFTMPRTPGIREYFKT